MAEERMPTVLLLVTVTYLVVLCCDCRPLDGYAFPVYTTDVCPRNLTEWRERSTTLNCTKENAYMCVPNENITELLEFCYSLPQIQITKGLCMFLYKHHSILDAFECDHFTEGCPSSNYRSQDVDIYQSCVAISNGCFLTDPICGRTTTMQYLKNNTDTKVHSKRTQISKHESTNRVWKVTLTGSTVILSIAVCIFSLRILVNEQLKKYYKHEEKQYMEENIEQGKKENQCDMMEMIDVDLNQIDETDRLNLTEDKTNDNADNKNPKSFVHSPLKIACFNGNDAMVQCLIEQGAVINLLDKDGYCPLSIACYKGYKNIVKILLENDADINLCEKDEASPLFIACGKGHDSTVQLLLNNGADINLCKKDGASPLFIACEQGHDSTVQLLLNNGADINLCKKDRASPLFIACEQGHDSTVQLLLNNGVDINLCENDGASPLYIACQNGEGGIVQLLLNNGADNNLCNKNGASPLYIACEQGHDSTVQLLLNNGADINLCENDGASPLFIACQGGHDSTVQLLLNNGADINLCRKDGASPLFIACQGGHDSTVQLLLNNGADINLCTGNGLNPLTIAIHKGLVNIVQLLTKNGAKVNLP